MVITLVVYMGIELFFIVAYQNYSSLTVILSSISIMFVSNIIASLLILIIALCINNFTSFSTFQTLYGVVIGFFTGVYIPIGYYPTIIRNIFFYFPLCQTTSLLRNIETNVITKDILYNYPVNTHHILYNYPVNIHHILYETFGIHLTLNDKSISVNNQILMLFIAIILLNLILIFIIYLKRYRK